MQHNQLIHYTSRLFFCAMGLSLLTMCGKTENSTVTLNGRASLGPIRGATVSVYRIKDDGTHSTLLGQSVTDEHGKFHLAFPAQIRPIEVEVRGGEYEEEAGAVKVSLGKKALRLLLHKADSSQEVGVDALTEIAAERAATLVKEDKKAIVTSILAAHKAVALAAGLSSNTEPADDSQHVEDHKRNRRRKALVLAGISKLSVDQSRNSLLQTYAFAEDFKDGKFDGKSLRKASVKIGSYDLSSEEWDLVEDKQVEFSHSEDNHSDYGSDDYASLRRFPEVENEDSESEHETLSNEQLGLGTFSILSASNEKITWSASSGASHYQLKISSKRSCSNGFRVKIPADQTSYSLSGLNFTSGVTYFVCVEAEDKLENHRDSSNNKFPFMWK